MTLRINGQPVDGELAPSATLLTVIREHLGLKGTKESCGRGECGACTVLVGGKPVTSCIRFAAVTDEEVVTVEGLADEARDLREAFAEFGGFQCGFCTAGQIVHSTALLRELEGKPLEGDALEKFLRHRLSGNICRCTGYNGIIKAVTETYHRRKAKRAGAVQ